MRLLSRFFNRSFSLFLPCPHADTYSHTDAHKHSQFFTFQLISIFPGHIRRCFVCSFKIVEVIMVSDLCWWHKAQRTEMLALLSIQLAGISRHVVSFYSPVNLRQGQVVDYMNHECQLVLLFFSFFALIHEKLA